LIAWTIGLFIKLILCTQTYVFFFLDKKETKNQGLERIAKN
jgi:hypothetical protein